jgi:hypothetical protein
MTFAIYGSVGTVGQEPEQLTLAHVDMVIENAPESTTREEVVQRLFSAGFHLENNAMPVEESEWPADVRRQVNSPSIHIRRWSWDNLR